MARHSGEIMNKEFLGLALLSALALTSCGGNPLPSSANSLSLAPTSSSSAHSETSSATFISESASSSSDSTVSTEGSSSASNESSSSEESPAEESSSSLSTSSETPSSEGLHYVFDEATKSATVSSFDGTETSVLIPASVNGYSVKAIGNSAFASQAKIVSVSLPVGLESIGDDAFNQAYALKNINFPEGLLSIGEYAFFYAPLTKIELPSTVQTIDSLAFASARSIASFSVDSSNPYFASDDGRVLTSKDGTIVYFYAPNSGEEYSLKTGTTSLRDFSFYDNLILTDLALPEGLTSIGNWALAYLRGVTSLVLPRSLSSLGSWALAYNANLTDLRFGGTRAEWAKVSASSSWNNGTSFTVIHCSDGDATL